MVNLFEFVAVTSQHIIAGLRVVRGKSSHCYSIIMVIRRNFYTLNNFIGYVILLCVVGKGWIPV